MTIIGDKDSKIYVIFRLGCEEYGLDIRRVQSIVEYEEPTPVPRCPESVLGVINLRGRVIPIIDLATRLGREPFVRGAGSRFLVVEGDAGVLGLAVDAAHEVTPIELDSIQPTPEAVVSGGNGEIFEGVAHKDGALVILIDLDRALPKATLGDIEQSFDTEGYGDV